MTELDKAAIANLIRRSNLDCMVEFRDGGLVTLLSVNRIDLDRVSQTFPYPWIVADCGKREWKERPDDMGQHYYVDLAMVQ